MGLKDIWQGVKRPITLFFDKRLRLCEGKNCTLLGKCCNKATWMIPDHSGSRSFYACANCKESYSKCYRWVLLDELLERPIIPCVHCGEPHMLEDSCEEQ